MSSRAAIVVSVAVAAALAPGPVTAQAGGAITLRVDHLTDGGGRPDCFVRAAAGAWVGTVDDGRVALADGDYRLECAADPRFVVPSYGTLTVAGGEVTRVSGALVRLSAGEVGIDRARLARVAFSWAALSEPPGHAFAPILPVHVRASAVARAVFLPAGTSGVYAAWREADGTFRHEELGTVVVTGAAGATPQATSVTGVLALAADGTIGLDRGKLIAVRVRTCELSDPPCNVAAVLGGAARAGDVTVHSWSGDHVVRVPSVAGSGEVGRYRVRAGRVTGVTGALKQVADGVAVDRGQLVRVVFGVPADGVTLPPLVLTGDGATPITVIVPDSPLYLPPWWTGTVTARGAPFGRVSLGGADGKQLAVDGALALVEGKVIVDRCKAAQVIITPPRRGELRLSETVTIDRPITMLLPPGIYHLLGGRITVSGTMAIATGLPKGASAVWTRHGCPAAGPAVGLARCVGTAAEPARLTVPTATCGVVVDAGNGFAGRCEKAKTCTFDGATSKRLALGRATVALAATGAGRKKASCESFVEVLDREPPTIRCPAPARVECGAPLPAFAATCTDRCGACTPSCQLPASTNLTGLGDVRCEARDAAGNAASCSSALSIVDTTRPSLSLTASPAALAPATGELVAITLGKTALDTCDAAPRVTCTAGSSDPADPARPDVVWTGDRLSLRAAAGKQPRTYTITCTAADAAGNARTATAKVTVPAARR